VFVCEMSTLLWSYTTFKFQNSEVKDIFWLRAKHIQLFLKNKLKTFPGLFSYRETHITLKAGCATFPLWESTHSQQASPRKWFLSLKNCRAEVLLVSGSCSCSQGLWRQGQLRDRGTNEASLFTSKCPGWGSASGLWWRMTLNCGLKTNQH